MIGVIIIGACLSVIALIVIAPWRRVRNEPPLDQETQSRLLLGEDVDKIAADANAAEAKALADLPIPLDRRRTD